MQPGPGRICPLHYRYAPADLAQVPVLAAETLYVIGGLYGNRPALNEILALAARETVPPTLVFNGDFNWFNVDTAGFRAINDAVLKHVALRGNVETELAAGGSDAGCGCAYPGSVSDGEVERSNAIMARLRATASQCPGFSSALGQLPMYCTAVVGGLRIAIVHGDAESLAGWHYAQDALTGPGARERLVRHFDEARARVIASSHTCLPVALDVQAAQGRCVLINNGAAGMPNFAGAQHGVITRIGVNALREPAPLYGTRLHDVHIDAVPVQYDNVGWLQEFLVNWPPGSPAHRSYYERIVHGPRHALTAAARWQ